MARRLLPQLSVSLLVLLGALGGSRLSGADAPGYERTVREYAIPGVSLVNHDGQRVDLKQALQAEQPVLLDFFFSTCNTICPVLSTSFSRFQAQLGTESQGVRLYSIAIDPEHDTPEVLRGYRERYGARPGWDLLTGSREDVTRVLKAFDAYTPNKMGHRPLNFLWSPAERRWVRLEGLVAASDLEAEYRRLRQP
jgi:protein SCO1/2